MDVKVLTDAMESLASAARANGYCHGLSRALEIMRQNSEALTPAYYAILDLQARVPTNINLSCDVPDEAPTT